MGKRSREKRKRREANEIQVKPEKEKGITSVLVGMISWLTYLILFTPLIISKKYFFPFVGPKSLFFMGLVEIIFFSWLFLIVFDPKYRPRLNILLIVLVLFLIVLIFSTFFGADVSRSFWSKFERMTGLLLWFHLFAFFLVISSVFKSEKDWFKIFAVSIFVATITSFIAIFSKSSEMRGGGTIGNDSFLGTYLIFNLFLALYLIFKTRDISKILSLISFSILVPSLLFIGVNLKELSFSQKIFALFFNQGARAAKISFFGGLILLFLFWLVFTKKGRLKFAGIALLLIFTIEVFSLIYLSLQPGNFVYQKVIQMATKSRFAVWQMAWKGFLEKPWLGWGPENFELVFAKYFNPQLFLSEYGGEIWFDRAHNIIFDTLVASGIFGLIFYLGIFIASFYILLKKFLQEKIEFSSLGIFSVTLISYFVQNLTVFDMINSYLMFFLVLGFVGSIASQNKPFHQYQEFGSLKKSLIVILLMLFSFSFLKFIIQPLRTDAEVVNAIHSSDPIERVSLYKKTLATSPLGKYQIRETFAETTINFAQSEAVKKVSVDDLKLEFEFITKELEKNRRESPLDFRAKLKLGQVYNTYSQIDPSKISQAETILKEAIELSPANQQGYWTLAQTKIYQGKFSEALSLTEKALELEKRFPQSHLTVIKVAKLIGDRELVKRKSEEAIKLFPNLEPEIKKILEK